MFTGIIKEIGEVEEVEANESSKTFRISCTKVIEEKSIDESIAVNGACVTITKLEEASFSFIAINETLEKTNLSKLKVGCKVNLEPAAKLSQSLDGHIVQGHIDQCAEVLELKEDQLSIKTPSELSQYIAYKGSISINGVSLTVSRLEDKYFKVALIPHTLENTNLGQLKKGDNVNIEIDIVSRYLERLLDKKNQEAKYEFLKDRNLI